MSDRAPEQIADLARALGDRGRVAAAADPRARPAARASASWAPTASRLDEALEAMTERPELGFTPDPPGREHLRAIVEAAW